MTDGDVSPWDRWISDDEREVIRRGGYARPTSLGERPSLLLIDCQKSVVGNNAPVLEQIDRYPSGVGEAAWSAVDALAKMLSTARSEAIPVIYTKIAVKSPPWGGGIYGERIQRRELEGNDDIVEPLVPEPGDPVLDKLHSSAFFGTSLLPLLIGQGIDTLLLGGGSTSGCVRATAVDAASLGFKVAVISDGTFDRMAVSHAAALLDVWMKYGSVRSTSEIVSYLRSIGGGSTT